MGWFSVLSFIFSTIVQHQQQKKAKERQKRAEEEAAARADRAKGISIVAEGESSPLNMVYGRSLVGGIRVYHNTSSSFLLSGTNSQKQFINNLAVQTGGQKHEYLTVQQVLCLGEINSCIHMDVERQDYDNIRFATVGPPSADYINTGGVGGLRSEVHYYGHVADQVGETNYPVLGTSKFPYLAYATSIFRLNRDDPQFGGVPTSTFYIEGLKVLDIVKSGENYSLGSRIYSNSPPLVLLDYLTNTLYGKGLSLEEIDLESFYKAKLICDTVVQTGVACEGKIWNKRGISSRNIPRFEANITLFSDSKQVDNIEKILDTMDYSELIWTAGRYKLLLNYPTVYTTFTAVPLTATALNGIVTVTFAALAFIPQVGSKVLLSGTTMTSTGNLTTDSKIITSATTSSVSFASTATGTLVTAGSISAAFSINDIVQVNSETSDIDMFISLVDDNISALNTANWRSAIAGYITDDDIVKRDEFKVSWPNASTRYNYATVRFRNEAKDFSEDSVGWPDKSTFVPGAGVNRGDWSAPTAYNKSDYVTHAGLQYQLRFGENRVFASNPTVDSTAWALVYSEDVYRTYITADNGVELESDIFAEGIVDYYHALAKAEGIVRSSRNGVVYNILLTHKYGGLEPNDFLKLTSDYLEIPGELLVVNSVSADDGGSIAVEATKFDARNLEWNAKDTEIIPPRNIFDENIAGVTNLTLLPSSVPQLSSGTLTWTLANDIRVSGYSIRETTVAVAEITQGTGMDIVGESMGGSFVLPSMLGGTKSLVVIPMLKGGGLAPFSSWRAVAGLIAPVSIDFTSDLPISVYRRLITAPATPTGGSYNFDTFQMATVPTDWFASIPTGTLDLYRSSTVVSAVNGTGTVNVIAWNTPELMTAAAVTLVADINNLIVLQNDVGANYGYASAIGNLKVYNGGTEVTSSTTFSIQSNTNCTAAIDNVTNKGRFSVSELAAGQNSGYFSIKTTYNGVDRFYNIDVTALNVGAVRDVTPPPTASGITVTAGFSTVFVDLASAPAYTEGHGHGYTVVYGAEGATPVFASAVEIHRFKGLNSSFSSTPGRLYKLWFKNFSNDEILSASPFGGTNGIDASTGLIGGTAIADAAIGNAKIGDLAVDSAKIANLAVTAAKIANATITAAQIADLTVTAAKIADATVTAAKIADLTVTAAKIADATITDAKIANLAVTAAKIADATITDAKIVNGTITAAKIFDATITNAKIADAAVDTLKLAGQSVTIPSSVYTAGQATFSSSATTVQSLTITSTGNPIVLTVTCSAYLYTVANLTYQFTYGRILRNAVDITGSVVIAADMVGNGTYTGGAAAFAVIDTPGVGTHTYYLQLWCGAAAGGSATGYAQSRCMTALEVKR